MQNRITTVVELPARLRYRIEAAERIWDFKQNIVEQESKKGKIRKMWQDTQREIITAFWPAKYKGDM
jgi:archaeosine-15-forming tRNA-guanine transglycosylase